VHFQHALARLQRDRLAVLAHRLFIGGRHGWIVGHRPVSTTATATAPTVPAATTATTAATATATAVSTTLLAARPALRTGTSPFRHERKPSSSRKRPVRMDGHRRAGRPRPKDREPLKIGGFSPPWKPATVVAGVHSPSAHWLSAFHAGCRAMETKHFQGNQVRWMTTLRGHPGHESLPHTTPTHGGLPILESSQVSRRQSSLKRKAAEPTPVGLESPITRRKTNAPEELTAGETDCSPRRPQNWSNTPRVRQDSAKRAVTER